MKTLTRTQIRQRTEDVLRETAKHVDINFDGFTNQIISTHGYVDPVYLSGPDFWPLLQRHVSPR